MNSVVIGLCVYNSAKGLPSVLKNIDKIKKYKLFTDIKIIACYDNSKDNSLDILETYEKDIIEIIKNENRTSKVKTENIAFARNKILERIREKICQLWIFYNDGYKWIFLCRWYQYECIGRRYTPFNISNADFYSIKN